MPATSVRLTTSKGGRLISVKLPQELKDLVDQACREEMRTQTQIIKLSLISWLSDHGYTL